MSWNKNTVVMSKLDTICEVLEELGCSYGLDCLGRVSGNGSNDYGDASYLIRRLAYKNKVILEQMVRHPDCDVDDILTSETFEVGEEPKDWPLEVTLDED